MSTPVLEKGPAADHGPTVGAGPTVKPLASGSSVGTAPEEVEIDDELLERYWVQYQKDPDFFGQISIAKDGGFSEVDELVGGMRYFTAFIAVGFVFLNAYSIISINLANIFNENSPTIFLITKELLIATDKAGSLPAWLREDTAVLGTLEIAMYCVYVLRMFYNCYQIACPGPKEITRWIGVQELFWSSMPEAAAISGPKLLNYVTPAVVVPDLLNIFTVGKHHGICSFVGNLIFFVVTRLLAGWIGFDAFLFKLQTTSIAISNSLKADEGIRDPLIYSFTFLNQTLGIVQLGWFVRKRIFAFIFAGEDGVLSPQEDALKEVWESMLARRIWQDLPPIQAIVAYLSYSDFDFQKLALETESKTARKITKKVSREQSGASLASAPLVVEMASKS